MPRNLESIVDIEKASQRIINFSSGISRIESETNEEKLSAILYQITIIGEANKRLSPTFRQQYPEIPWRNLAGMRDIIIHEYEQFDLDIVWDVIQNKIPELLVLLEPILPNPTDE